MLTRVCLDPGARRFRWACDASALRVCPDVRVLRGGGQPGFACERIPTWRPVVLAENLRGRRLRQSALYRVSSLSSRPALDSCDGCLAGHC